ncbi:SIMPL domain-containing protein [Campylobacter corcagiensis]|uniref:SIMPL domain-containing protein n=1 Tax=Campylobacter corcagiensis TaxID=1448857 RepID=A0A7M1LGE9_9BACT|nr:SIMPL domain-containing protein [Campylobacter corcagiensis]QKF64132.1 SIMPL domain-containing protein [Campylobacter corcagiensis]QOQ87672.1 SIMPL domain-containing protein [Campylobacter corcagiensis]
MKKFIVFFIFFSSLLGTEVTVYAEDEITLAPDSMVVNLQISSTANTLSDAKAKNDEMSSKLYNYLADNNISKDSTRVVSTNLYTDDNYDSNGTIVAKSYRATKFIAINLAKNSDEILNNIIDMGVSYADIGYKNSEISAYKQKSLENALNLAIIKAKKLAKSINKDVSSIVKIEEIPAENLFYGAKSSGIDNPVILVKSKVKLKVLLKDE